MAFLKAAGCMVVTVVMYYSLEIQGYNQSLDVCFEVLATEPSHIPAKEKREATSIASDYLLQLGMTSSDWERLQTLLSTVSFPFVINSTVEIASINTTTVCSSNMTGYECRCEQSFAWSYNNCVSHGACDAIVGDKCGCITGLPEDGQQCQANTSQTGIISTTITTTTATLNTTTTPMVPKTTTTSNTAVSPTTEERNLSFALDLDFDPSYNNPTSSVYQSTNQIIQEQCREHIPNLVSAKIIAIRSGSTIVDYAVTATSLQEAEVRAVQTGITNALSEIYPLLINSKEFLKFDPPDVFFGKSVMVECEPPSTEFSTNWIAEWRRDGILITEDNEHSFSTQNGSAILMVSKFFSTDNGNYECRLRGERIVFRQISDGEFIVKDTPLIQVTPVVKKVGCEVGKEVSLNCIVNAPYVVIFRGIPAAGKGRDITYKFVIPDCENLEQKFYCYSENFPEFNKEITLLLSRQNFVCFNDSVFGDGVANDTAVGPCKPNFVGERTAVCKDNGTWELLRDNCILQPIQDLLVQSEVLNKNSLPVFLDQLSNVTVNFTVEVAESSPTINAIVQIMNNVANASSLLHIPITDTSMEDILITTGVLTIDAAKGSWDFLNANDTKNVLGAGRNMPIVESVSAKLLLSLENLTGGLTNDSFNINTPFILLNKTTFTDTFSADFNSSVEVNIPESDGRTKSLTVITFDSMDNILPARNKDNSSFTVINGKVVLVQSSGAINNVSFTFDTLNDTLGNPQCVFWNFSLFEGLGGWDNKGCELAYEVNQSVTCNCTHLTSFSILMSPFSPDDPLLDIITYIGVGISMASLVICLIIEAVIWRKIRKNTTSYLRHVSIVNIATSLVIANIWFIIGANISDAKEKNTPACSAATFFIHFFYLALFFWMLASALLLLYRTVSVFDGGLSKRSMLAVGFSLGYGAPVIIATITVAVTAPRQQYFRVTGVCWLNWDESKALLAFVIPALVIVVINFVILLVVLSKILMRRSLGDAARADDRHVLVVIARTLAVLTPFFGLTWALGVGTMTDPYNRGIHIAFAFFNSLQGFFILLFGTLLDKKVQSELTIKSQTSRSTTGSSSVGTSSSSGLGFFRNWRRGRDVYNISSSASTASQSVTNT